MVGTSLALKSVMVSAQKLDLAVCYFLLDSYNPNPLGGAFHLPCSALDVVELQVLCGAAYCASTSQLVDESCACALVHCLRYSLLEVADTVSSCV